MSRLTFTPLPITVGELHARRNELNFAPSYQRKSDLWERPKQQLFIDSLLNGFDIPKLYFYDLLSAKDDKSEHRYALIDGKQRLEAIFKFLDGQYPLNDDCELFEDEGIRLGALTFGDLTAQLPSIAARLTRYPLPVTVVATDDIELVEEMFARLNEAVPLNGPEKRNSRGGPLPPVIRRLAKHAFFLRSVPFADARYRHLDLACKFLLIEHRNGLVDTKKRALDSFVDDFKARAATNDAADLEARVTDVLARLVAAFEQQDSLLQRIGMLPLYYELGREVRMGTLDAPALERDTLARFEALRATNRSNERYRQVLLEKQEPIPSTVTVDARLSDFDRKLQSTNDGAAMRDRYNLLKAYIKGAAEFDIH